MSELDGRKVMKWDGEARTHERAVQYLKSYHPNVIFRTDFAAGIKLPPWIAKRQKILQWRRGFPDITLYQPARPEGYETFCHGLVLEIKAAGVKLKTRDGRWAEDHFREQYEMLVLLKSRGYAAAFARGYEEICAVFEWYLTGTESLDFGDDLIPINRNAETIEGDIF